MSEVRVRGGQDRPGRGTEQEIPAELVLLAMGFVARAGHRLRQLGVSLDERGNVARDKNYATDVDGVFVCGDAGRGQSLIVWAIAEGRLAPPGWTIPVRLHQAAAAHPADRSPNDGLRRELTYHSELRVASELTSLFRTRPRI
jgi:glutamate synthase (NADPH/NADH) small chain